MTRTRALLVVVALIVALAPTTLAAETVDEPADQSPNLEAITNLDFDEPRDTSVVATDLDFLSVEVQPGWTLPPGLAGERPDLVPTPGETRDFALVGSFMIGMQVVDITDRENPGVVATYDCGVTQGDIFIFDQEQDDGSTRTLTTYTSDPGGPSDDESRCHTDLDVRADQRGTFLVDVTNPYEPTSVSFIEMRKGTHQVTVDPSGEYLYNSAAVLQVDVENLGTLEVFDVSEPETPQLTSELDLVTGLDSHDITFNDEGTRAYSSAINHTLILDTTETGEPEAIGRIIDPAINIHHEAHKVTVDTPAGERDYLLIGDELTGAMPNGYCPGGGVHVYDITGPLEEAPVKVGAFFIPDVRPVGITDGEQSTTCTAHVMQVLPEQEQIVMAWYNAGVRVLDYSGLADLGPAGPSLGVTPETGSLGTGIQEVGYLYFTDSVLWAAKTPEVEADGSFYIYGGDRNRAFDVFRFDADAPSAADPGEWLDPTAALERARQLDAQLVPGADEPYCLLPGGF